MFTTELAPMTTLKVNYKRILGSLGVGVFFGAFSVSLAAEMNTPAATAEMVVTIESGSATAAGLSPGTLKIYQGETRRNVRGVERLSGERAAMELFLYLDDSIDSAALDAFRPDLERFIKALPETTKVAVGRSMPAQGFTADHERAVASLGQPGQKPDAAGTYSALLDLMRQWPSQDQEQAGRRAVLILANGENRLPARVDPYVEAAWRNARIGGVSIYSIFVRSGDLQTAAEATENDGQSSLLALSSATGGHSYRAANSDSLRPLLEDLEVRLANQYRITFEPKNYAGTQRVTVQTDMAGVTITAPTGIYVRQKPLTASLKYTGAGEQQLAQVMAEPR
jgi:hypothetical protein